MRKLLNKDGGKAKPLSMIPNYRESRSINFRKAFFKIDKVLEGCIENMSTKNKSEILTLAPWRKSVLTMIKEKIKKPKQKI